MQHNSSESRRPSFSETSPLSNDPILLKDSWQEHTHLWGIRKGLNRWLLLGPAGPETPGLPATPSEKERKNVQENLFTVDGKVRIRERTLLKGLS